MPEAANSPARILAPVALVVCAIAFFVVLMSSDAGEDGGTDEATPAGQAGERRTTTGQTVRRSQRRFYRVQPNDSLDAIAQRFGLEVEELQELNPNADPQGLVVGQRLQLRE